MSNKISMTDEEIKEHLKDPNYSSRSLEPWTLNPAMRRKTHEFMQEVIKKMMEHPDVCHFYNYMEYCNMNGDPGYKKAVAKFLSHFYRHPVDTLSLVATYGASFGFYLVMTEFFEKGDYLFVEDLTYMRILITGRNFGLKIISNNCDDDGIDIKEFEANLQKYQNLSTHKFTPKKPYWGMVYLLTQLHNPKGTSYSEARCKQVVALAQKYNVLVITDDVYFPFSYESNDNKGDVLVAYDKSNWSSGTGNVVSNGSLSKILYPSIRVGWMEASPWFIERFSERADLISSGGYNAYNQRLCSFALNSPKFMKHFEESKAFYAHKMKIACDFLEEHLPNGVTFRRPKGSFFIWLKLPEGCDSKELLKRCQEFHIMFVLGEYYSSDPDPNKYVNHFRLAVCNLEERELFMSLNVICTQAKLCIEERKIKCM